jgi:DNA primase
VFYLAGFIPEQIKSDIQNAADMVEVVGETVLLKKAGRNFVGLCPFHSEKTPSFTVSPDKQIFHCFGCGAGGDVFTFLMKQDGLSFPEAARTLGRRYGVEIPEKSRLVGTKMSTSEREEMIRANQSALNFFRYHLFEHPDGERARAYLKKRRISKKISDRFGLGYAPRDWEALHRNLSKNGVALKIAKQSGLIIPRKNSSGCYDRFRDRIIFPIFHLNGQVIGFGGRVLDDTLPKYINSPDSIVFNKSQSLYGLQQSKEACRKSDSVIIVEGNVDVLALHQHGIKNVVATLGTALTTYQIRRLKGFATQFFLVYDSDDSGIKASERIVGLFIKENVDVHVAILPAGHDPDSYLTEFGTDSFLKVVSDSLKIMPFLTECGIKKYGMSTEGKIRILEDLKLTLSSISDRVSRLLYVKEISERIGVDESALLEKVRNATVQRVHQKSTRHLSDPSRPSDVLDVNRSANRIEQQVIAIMLQCPDLIPEIMAQKIIEQFADENLKSIGWAVGSSINAEPQRIQNIISAVNHPEKERIIARLAMTEEKWNRDAALKLIAHFKNIRRRNSNYRLNRQIQAAEERGDQETVNELLRQKQIQAINPG